MAYNGYMNNEPDESSSTSQNMQQSPPLPNDHAAGPRTKLVVILVLVTLCLMVACGTAATSWWIGHRSAQNDTPQTAATTDTTHTTTTTPAAAASTQIQGVQLDTSKNYGNKYANGVLPVGDGKYTTAGAKQGYVYACGQYASSLANGGGGAQARGPWFTDNNTAYNINQKTHVLGSVNWQGSITNTIAGATRTIITNNLPNHPTGIFPIAASDPAYTYDRNPNHIAAQSLTYALAANPTYGTPACMGGEAGVMLTVVALFNAFDAGGRDAGAWEVQDGCSGHPDAQSEYHYHTLSSCIKDTSVHTVIGFALDGFPITGPAVGPNNVLTTADLDECHGLTSSITLDGKQVTMYHYVMTQDFPYSVSCFRGTAIQPPNLGHQQPGARP